MYLLFFKHYAAFLVRFPQFLVRFSQFLLQRSYLFTLLFDYIMFRVYECFEIFNVILLPDYHILKFFAFFGKIGKVLGDNSSHFKHIIALLCFLWRGMYWGGRGLLILTASSVLFMNTGCFEHLRFGPKILEINVIWKFNLNLLKPTLIFSSLEFMVISNSLWRASSSAILWKGNFRALNHLEQTMFAFWRFSFRVPSFSSFRATIVSRSSIQRCISSKVFLSIVM